MENQPEYFDISSDSENQQAEQQTENQPIETTTTEKIDKRKLQRAPWRTITNEDGTTKYNSTRRIDCLLMKKFIFENTINFYQ